MGIDLFSVYYKTQAGPLGFNLDHNGTSIFRHIAEGAIWYNVYNGDFKIMDAESIEGKQFFNFNGIFMIANDYINQEIEKEKVLRATQKRNQLLQRYSKPMLEEMPSLFTNIYSKKSVNIFQKS